MHGIASYMALDSDYAVGLYSGPLYCLGLSEVIHHMDNSCRNGTEIGFRMICIWVDVTRKRKCFPRPVCATHQPQPDVRSNSRH
jgi:hypothetical protein